MIAKYIAIAIVGAASFAAISSHADITQTFNFSTNASFSESSSVPTIPRGFFSATFSPYSGDSNDLTGFQIDWTITFSASALSKPGFEGGFSGGPGGNYLVNSVGYDGNGGSLSASASSPGGAIPLTTITVTNDRIFLTANAGLTYDPALLANILGASPLDLKWDTDFSLGYGSILSGDFSETGSVTLIYNTVPEPGTLALAGLGASVVCWLRRRKA